MKITRRKITASTNDYDVFMLMDDTHCIAKFFARDLDDAENQFFEMQEQYPEFAESLYVRPFNLADDNFNYDNLLDSSSNEVYSDLSVVFDEWADNYSDWNSYYEKDLPFTSTQITAGADESSTEVDNEFDIRWDEKFGEPSTEVFTADEFDDWMQEVMEFE